MYIDRWSVDSKSLNQLQPKQNLNKSQRSLGAGLHPQVHYNYLETSSFNKEIRLCYVILVLSRSLSICALPL